MAVPGEAGALVIVVTVASWLVLAAFVVACWPRINAERRWRAVALALALVFSLTHQLLYDTVSRDAFVTFRYARNVTEGHGLVYNPGEYVEGYTNFLWLVLLALPGGLLGEDAVVVGARVLGVLATLGCVLSASALARAVVGRARPAGPGMPAVGVAAATLTAGASSLAAYGPSGLATPLFVLLTLVICLALVAGRPLVAGVLAALATMTRPGGALLVVVAVGWLVVEAVRGRKARLAPVACALGALVVLVPWTAWRVTMYGHLVPNAVAARWGGSLGERLSHGWDYLAGFALAYQALVLLAVAAGALLLNRGRVDDDVTRARSLVVLLFVLAGLFSAAVVTVGGDWLPTWRLLAPVPVLLAVASTAAYGIVALTEPTDAVRHRPDAVRAVPLVHRRTAPVVALAVTGLSLVVTTMHPMARPATADSDRVVAGLEEVGAWFGEALPAGTVVATHATGALGYRAGPSLTVVDVFGRTDEHIARNAAQRGFVGTRFLARDYDYVVSTRVPAVAVEKATYTPEQQCGINPAYAGLFEVASFRRAASPHWVTVYVRSALSGHLIDRLDAHPDYEYVSCR